MNQQALFAEVSLEKFNQLNDEEKFHLFKGEQDLSRQIREDNHRLRSLAEELKQKTLNLNEQYITLKNKFFGKSSEREPSKEDRKKGHVEDDGTGKKVRVQLPSLRYPDAPLIERDIILEKNPQCPCCDSEMSDSGMTENSEFLTVIPAQFIVIRQKRHKYRCGKCHGAITTAPAPPRVKPGSSYSDEMMIDVALSKYCDLIPIDRYTAIAGREGLMDLPPQSLIGLTHDLADFFNGAYEKCEQEILSQLVVHGDETPHKMLEGDEKSSWYMWGFSTLKTSYFECRDTRSGDVASEFLKRSRCEFLVSDVYSGYGKAIRETNELRRKSSLPLIKSVYCNAHSRRYFKRAKEKFLEEAEYFVDHYKEIYHLEGACENLFPEETLVIRKKMKKLFKKMKARAEERLKGFSSKSSIAVAMKYFLKNYKELTLFLGNPLLPIDNNPQERQFRSPVVGRKTWYGTHSKRGAKTLAIHFTLVEGCKLNGVNPRIYYKELKDALHRGEEPFTPYEFTKRIPPPDG
jgi:transposase